MNAALELIGKKLAIWCKTSMGKSVNDVLGVCLETDVDSTKNADSIMTLNKVLISLK